TLHNNASFFGVAPFPPSTLAGDHFNPLVRGALISVLMHGFTQLAHVRFQSESQLFQGKPPCGGLVPLTVNARDLHAFLEVGSAFKDWIARRIQDYDFQDGKDFCSFLSESQGGRPAKEYALLLEMAKEMAIVGAWIG